MDDEDTNNSSSHSGWIGAFDQPRGSEHVLGTRLGICRTYAQYFENRNLWMPANASLDMYTYAVLKLSDECPAGSSPQFWRQIDNENDDNENSVSGDIWPNGSNSTDGQGWTQLNFCVFLPSTSGVIGFPNIGMRDWGVFGGGIPIPPGSGWLDYYEKRGDVHTDDEDDDNNNFVDPNAYLSEDEKYWIDRCCISTHGHDTGGENTDFHQAKININGPTSVPTLSEWGLIILSALLMSAGIYRARLRGARQGSSPKSVKA